MAHDSGGLAIGVKAVQDIFDRLDYSIRSLADVDSILTHFEERGSERTAEVTAASGFYAGEVLVRNHGFRWVAVNDFPELDIPEVLHFSIASPTSGGTYSIVNKAFKRVENGAEDDLACFGQFIVAQENASRA
ncbi:hypothetical protein M3147_14465 [Agromyces mediolanus]|uniref:hypothetical protein n=1 Tax=Agromyces mediolanus TaxID=41986 RepID=UPI00203AAA33|nr:hypothetical protein [Agromyces mediolanus]MCM3658457.1 hypothetical protein [Agromyces mediolanus]